MNCSSFFYRFQPLSVSPINEEHSGHSYDDDDDDDDDSGTEDEESEEESSEDDER